jgi:hypothetical protein
VGDNDRVDAGQRVALLRVEGAVVLRVSTSPSRLARIIKADWEAAPYAVDVRVTVRLQVRDDRLPREVHELLEELVDRDVERKVRRMVVAYLFYFHVPVRRARVDFRSTCSVEYEPSGTDQDVAFRGPIRVCDIEKSTRKGPCF